MFSICRACSPGRGPAQNLADLGAEVIKVERPKKGDDSRAFGPPWLKDAQGQRHRRVGVLRLRQPRQEIDHRRPLQARRARRSCASSPRAATCCSRTTSSATSRATGWATTQLKAVNPRLDLLLGDRLRPDRAVARAPRLRLHDPGHGRADERHRRARRPARRRAAEGGHPDRRHHHRHVRERSRSAPRSRTAPRPARASISISRCSIRWSRCSPTRARTISPPAKSPGAARQRASEHRALPDVQDRGRQRDRRLRQRQPVPQVLRGRRLPRSSPTTRASRPTASASRTAPS